jgi:hypothetical protein
VNSSKLSEFVKNIKDWEETNGDPTACAHSILQQTGCQRIIFDPKMRPNCASKKPHARPSATRWSANHSQSNSMISAVVCHSNPFPYVSSKFLSNESCGRQSVTNLDSLPFLPNCNRPSVLRPRDLFSFAASKLAARRPDNSDVPTKWNCGIEEDGVQTNEMPQCDLLTIKIPELNQQSIRFSKLNDTSKLRREFEQSLEMFESLVRSTLRDTKKIHCANQSKKGSVNFGTSIEETDLLLENESRV